MMCLRRQCSAFLCKQACIYTIHNIHSSVDGVLEVENWLVNVLILDCGQGRGVPFSSFDGLLFHNNFEKIHFCPN